MSESFDSLQAPAVEQLERVRVLAEQCGLVSSQLPKTGSAVHADIVFAETEFVVLSIEFGSEGILFLSAGVLRDIEADTLTALEGCNARTRSRPSYPCFLASAAGPYGADVMIQQGHSTQLLLESPGFFKHSIESAPGVTRDTRERLVSLGGYPFRWTQDEAQRVAVRAV